MGPRKVTGRVVGRGWWRLWVSFGVLTAILTAGLVYWQESGGKPTGDPGGRELAQLVQAASALPGYGTSALPWMTRPRTSGPYLVRGEPHLTSCDGNPATRGWSTVSVQGVVLWSRSSSQLFYRVGLDLATLGWHLVPVPRSSRAVEAMWRMKLTHGARATVVLNLAPTHDHTWDFEAIAPPVGRRVTGC